MMNDYFESRMSRNEWTGVGKGKYFQQRGTRITCRTSSRDVQCRSRLQNCPRKYRHPREGK